VTRFAALREKYVEMLRMRRDETPLDRPADMARLAERFPGALREIDTLTLDEIESRIAILDEVIAGTTPAPDWVRFLARYHGWLRAALRIKRLTLDAPDLDAAMQLVRDAYVPAPDEPPLTRIDRPTLDGIRAPEHGRLNPWVFARVAEDERATPEEVARQCFISTETRRDRFSR
jgi:hypothetical protein